MLIKQMFGGFLSGNSKCFWSPYYIDGKDHEVSALHVNFDLKKNLSINNISQLITY
jgi:hypothetical protein